ncbi:chaoptin [Galendromus occidentalis]|uniref:Chaoptin n=1 Tax=Galendromus occidentalis TaxID=34638 RepID=A0AAJ7SGU1_9ACAR|nr:chaoptin [Galendromus occidentalis]
MSWTRLAVVVLLLVAGGYGRQCRENPLCVCNTDLSKDVICDGVAFARLPLSLLDNQVTTTLVIMRSNISEIADDVFFDSKLTALNIADSHLSRIGICAFCGNVESTLVTLDLSGNRFYEFPIRSLVKLQNLRWLSLRRNHIKMLEFEQDEEGVGSPLYDNLVSLYLSDNHIGTVRPGTFTKFTRLQTLELNNNGLTLLEENTFPQTLVSLHLDGNLLTVIPFEAFRSLESLQWLHLRDNHIAKVTAAPHLAFNSLILFDLGDNLIRSIAEPLTNGVNVQLLKLDGNHLYKIEPSFFDQLEETIVSLNGNILSSLDPRTFARYKPKRIDLSCNSFERAPVEALEESQVKHLNLSRNHLKEFEARLCQLTKLFISQNRLEEIPSLPCSKGLKVLDVSKNSIRLLSEDSFPFTNLHTLDISDNAMLTIGASPFKYLVNLKDFNLAHNRLSTIPADLIDLLRSVEYLNAMNNALEGFINLANLTTLKRLDLRLNPRLREDVLIGSSIQELDFSFTKISTDFIIPTARRLSKYSFQLFPSESLRSLFAQNFPDLTTIDLRYSAISRVGSNALYYLPNLEFVHLSHCRIDTLDEVAFNRLPALQLLDLSHNRLRNLSLSSFCQLSDFDIVPSTVDLSHNQIKSLRAQDDHLEYECQNYITVLNLKHNHISDIDFDAFLTVKNTLLELDLSHNLLGDQQLKKFIDLKRVSRLNLSHNRLAMLPRRAMTGLFNLQELDLSSNLIQQITPSALASLPKLRAVDLSSNNISFIPIDAFNGTSIEVLNLERNQLPSLKNAAFRSIGSNLTELYLSHNDDMHALTNGEFAYLTQLLHLSISNCGIKTITPGSFNDLSLLISLDISNNWLSYLEAQVFENLALLQRLDLSNCSLRTLPSLHVPELRFLSLASNRLEKLHETSFTTAREIQDLDLSNNRLKEVPTNIWSTLAELRFLKLAANPLLAIPDQSFHGLELLESLWIERLWQLRHIDIRSLSLNRRLTSLSTWTYTGKQAFRLEALLSRLPALRELEVEVEVRTLSDQIQWGFGHKLRRLHLRGKNWTIMAGDALSGLGGVENTNKKEIEIIVSDTFIEDMHFGFIEKLTRQPRRVNLDLRRNTFQRFFSEKKDDVLNTTQAYPQASLGWLAVDTQESCECSRNNWILAWRARAPIFVPTLCREFPASVNFIADVRCSPIDDYTAIDDETKRRTHSFASSDGTPGLMTIVCTLLSILILRIR